MGPLSKTQGTVNSEDSKDVLGGNKKTPPWSLWAVPRDYKQESQLGRQTLISGTGLGVEA